MWILFMLSIEAQGTLIARGCTENPAKVGVEGKDIVF